MDNHVRISLCKILSGELKNRYIKQSKLFHYTKNENKEKIVCSNHIELKFSLAKDFLDKNEGIQILEPFYHACGILYEEDKIDVHFYNLLKSITQKDLLSGTQGCWIFCFSKNGNSSFLKRRYAAQNGWILSFPVTLYDDICIEIPDCLDEFDLFDVEYSFKKVVNKIKTKLLKCYQLYQEVICDDKYDVFKEEILQWLMRCSFSYKGTDYKFEEEIRLLVRCNSGNFVWENEQHTIKMEMVTREDQASLIMTLDLQYLLMQTQEISKYFGTALNRQFLSAQEIRKALKND